MSKQTQKRMERREKRGDRGKEVGRRKKSGGRKWRWWRCKQQGKGKSKRGDWKSYKDDKVSDAITALFLQVIIDVILIWRLLSPGSRTRDFTVYSRYNYRYAAKILYQALDTKQDQDFDVIWICRFYLVGVEPGISRCTVGTTTDTPRRCRIKRLMPLWSSG